MGIKHQIPSYIYAYFDFAATGRKISSFFFGSLLLSLSLSLFHYTKEDIGERSGGWRDPFISSLLKCHDIDYKTPPSLSLSLRSCTQLL